nr:hypothetical protein [uncultured Actinotalea sp.]
MSRASVRVRAHWVNGWFLRLFARPVVVVDGVEVPARWGQATELELPDRPSRIGAGVRYRGTRALLGCEPEEVAPLPTADGVAPRTVELRNGPWNHSPFRVVRR